MLTLLSAGAAAQDESNWKLQGDVEAMTGQYFFNDAAGSVNGYANGDLQLLRSIDSRSGFYLDARSTYTGFKQVDELAGGGTLFQQTWENFIGGKWIQRFDDGWSLKPRVGVHDAWFRETTDEQWNHGLYDYMRYEGGVVLEHKGRLDALGRSNALTQQFSYDFYYTHYPHFQSLANQFGTEQAAPDPGARVLDTMSHQFGYRADADLPNFISASLFYSLALVDFTDQKVVDSNDAFPGNKRLDLFQNLSLSLSKRFDDWPVFGRMRPVIGLGAAFSYLESNQNHYDTTNPSFPTFVGDYYGYWETRVSPTLTTTFLSTKATMRTGAEFASRFYTGRLSQNADGSYMGRRLHQYTESVFLEGSYPIWRELELKARGSWSNTSANTAFEQNYQYNYHDYNYFAGLGWRF